MDRDPEVLFQEAWERVARRVNVCKHSKDRIRFFLTDGTTKTFDILPMQSDSMKDEFLEITLNALNNHSVEALLLNYEAWFTEAEENVPESVIDAYLRREPRFIGRYSKRKEGVNFYYETADGTILTTLAEIVTIEGNKRELAKISKIMETKTIGRMSHFFQKAREHLKRRKDSIDDIIQRN